MSSCEGDEEEAVRWLADGADGESASMAPIVTWTVEANAPIDLGKDAEVSFRVQTSMDTYGAARQLVIVARPNR